MKKFITNLAIALSLFFTQAAICNKPNKKNVDCNNNTIPLPRLAKDLFIFNKGSWWVYKNTSTNEIDSIYVDYVLRNTSNYYSNFGGFLDKCYESNSTSLISTKIEHINFGIGPSTPDGIKEFKYTEFLISTYTNLRQNGYYKLFFKGDSIIQSPQIGSSLTFKDSVNIQNNIFINVMIHLIGPNNIDFYEEAIYARNI